MKKRIIKVIIPIFSLVFAICLFLINGMNVYASGISDILGGIGNTLEEDLDVFEPSDYDDIPEEYKELYSVDKYDWYKVKAEYWLVYHQKHNIDLGDTFMATGQYCCHCSGYNYDRTYAFTRFTLPDGVLINDVRLIHYRYTNEDGKADDYWQDVNILENNNTEYDYNGTFISMDNIVGFDNGSGAQLNGTIVPGLNEFLNDGVTYNGLFQSKKNKPCKLGYSHEELSELVFDGYQSENESVEVAEYKPCNYLMYWDEQCIKRLAYIDVWWAEKKVNEETGEIEEVINRGTFTDDSTFVGIDGNGNVGVYSIDKELLTGYKVREDGVVINPDGEPQINWDDQCNGIVVNPGIQTNEQTTIFGGAETNNTLKYAFYLTCAIIGGVLILWLLVKINNFLQIFKVERK